ncbi:MAG TPA: hypothetical protein VMW81_07920 [Nitrospinota bacterium]|nr:hypothetical protein [Nitrospinota bacterium]
MHWTTGLLIGLFGLFFMASTENVLGDYIGIAIVIFGAALAIKLKRKL